VYKRLSDSILLLLLFSLWLLGCGKPAPPESATLTLNKDKSHFSGTVVGRDKNSITLVGQDGFTHTFLLSEVSDIRYGLNGNSDFSAVPDSVTPPPHATSGEPAVIVRIPAGTLIPVRAGQFIDSCCSPIGTLVLGASDADVKGAGGKILIPQGANVTFTVRDQKTVEGRVTMQFELGSADFNNRHFLITSAAGGQEPGAVVTLVGSRDSGMPGKSLHIEDNSSMIFRATTLLVMKSSQ
jgi:hypothetical protein